jgi:hypothetical protein
LSRVAQVGLKIGEPDLTRTRARAAILSLILVVSGAVAACGGDGGGDEDPSQVLDQTFRNPEPIDSGVLDLSLDGSAGAQGSVRATLSGPFDGLTDTSTVPQADLAASIDVQGVTQSFNVDGGLTVTGENAYVTYGGQAYEIGTQIFRQIQSLFAQNVAERQRGRGERSFSETCKRLVRSSGGHVAACDIDVASWVTNLSNEGTESVEGEKAIHVSGDADVERIFSDLSGIVRQLPGAGDQARGLSQLERLERAITSATIDVYSGADDRLLRRLDLGLSVDLSALSSASVIPLGTLDLTVSLILSDLNSPQTITPPENPRPGSDLGGGLGPLGSLDGG